MGVRHSGQPLSIAATASALQLSQNREWPHGTRATTVRGEIKQTSQQSIDCGDCAAVSVAPVSLDGFVTSCCGSCCCGALSSFLIVPAVCRWQILPRTRSRRDQLVLDKIIKFSSFVSSYSLPYGRTD